jgi:hypothetical protein
VRDGQTSPLRPRLVVSRNTCPPLSPSPHANSLTHTPRRRCRAGGSCGSGAAPAAAAAAPAGGKAAAPVAAAKKTPVPEREEDMGFSVFDYGLVW